MSAKQICLISLFLVFGVFKLFGQGSLSYIYDQQSDPENKTSEGPFVSIAQVQPLGQSFTPALNSVGFIRLFLYDSTLDKNLGAVLNVVVRSGSITGGILGTSDPVVLNPGFAGYPDFIFSTPLSLTPGTTYFFQPVLQSGNMGIFKSLDPYGGGTAFYKGAPLSSSDLWFREGLVVPEPSTWALLLLGGALAWGWRRRC